MEGGFFLERYGGDPAESLIWRHHQPQSVAGQLQARGLLAEGLIEGEVYVIVPLELRDLLQKEMG